MAAKVLYEFDIFFIFQQNTQTVRLLRLPKQTKEKQQYIPINSEISCATAAAAVPAAAVEKKFKHCNDK